MKARRLISRLFFSMFMRCPKQACCWALSSYFHCLLLEEHLCAGSISTRLQRHDLVRLLLLQLSSFWFILPNQNRLCSCGFSQYLHKEYFSLILDSAPLLGNVSETKKDGGKDKKLDTEKYIWLGPVWQHSCRASDLKYSQRKLCR